MMKNLYSYLTNPATWISFIVFIFGLGVVWSSTNSRLSALEEKCHEVDTVKAQMYEIQTTLAQIQTDVQWVKMTLQK